MHSAVIPSILSHPALLLAEQLVHQRYVHLGPLVLKTNPFKYPTPTALSVLARVTSIFTGTSISPDALSRQCSNHYAFRAGRNLPDKEFRYLRTVIVTAAVYWGLNSKLRLL